MKEIHFEKYRSAWAAEPGFEKKTLTESDIHRFLRKQSKEISKLFKKGLVFDIVLKSIIGLSFIALLFLFRSSIGVLGICSILLVGIFIAIRFQAGVLRKIPQADFAMENVRSVLEGKINFYKKKYLDSLYVGALSNALLIISGMLYYFYFKYGKVRPLEWGDYFVFGMTVILGFVLGVFMQVRFHNFQIHHLESSLTEIDENTINELTLKKQKDRKRKTFLVFLLAIICGLLVGAFILARTH